MDKPKLLKAKVEIKGKNILSNLDNIPDNCEAIIDEEIEKFMVQLKTNSQTMHPWMSQSGRLEASHEYHQVAPMEWVFTVNPEKLGADVDYGALLEYNLLNYSRSYTWVDPQVKALKPAMIASIKKKIQGTSGGGFWGKVSKFFGKFFGG